MSQGEKVRNKEIDCLRGIGIILMIMGHIGYGDAFYHWIHAFHMPLFFIVSGFFLDGITGKEAKDFVVKKARGLLIPYFSFALFHLVVLLIIDTGVDVRKQLYRILFYPTIGMPIAGALWFLASLFWAEVIFYCICCFWGEKKELLILLSSLGVGLVGMLLMQRFSVRLAWGIDSALVGVGFMGIGWFLKKKYHTKFIQKCFDLNIFVWVLLCVVNIYMIFANDMVNMRNGFYPRYGWVYVNATLAVLLIWNFCIQITQKIVGQRKIVQTICSIGQNSLVFVCLNQLVIKVIKSRVENVFNEAVTWQYYLSHIIALFIVCFICYIFMLVLENSKLKICLGKRK